LLLVVQSGVSILVESWKPELNESITALGDMTGISTPPTMAKKKTMASTTLRAIVAAADVNAKRPTSKGKEKMTKDKKNTIQNMLKMTSEMTPMPIDVNGGWLSNAQNGATRC
jgi:hypothetical protein